MPYNYIAMEKRIKTTFTTIEKHIYEKVSDLNVTAWLTNEPVSFDNRKEGREVKLKPGDNWGGLFDCAWFNFRGVVPVTVNKRHVLIIDVSGEGCIVNKKGTPIQGITTFACMYDFKLGMPGKRVVQIDKLIDEKGNLDLWMDAGNNDLFGNLKNNGTLVDAYIAECNDEMLGLYYDFEVLTELRTKIPDTSARNYKILDSLYKASLELLEFTNEDARKARELTAKELKRRNIDPPLKINAIGHSHIDLAWLWPIRESVRKGARTFSTVLMNLEKYPDYIFGASQPQLYQWMKEYYPMLYENIKEAVKKGRWELQGAMWVEADTNITGGEALVRQMLYGKKFYKEEFGVDVRNLWLPDVFGYSAVLPQIMKKSDVDYFMTTKISWNDFNKFPHHTFIWKGIDGSEVLAHMPPEGTYNSSAAPRAISDSEKNYTDKLVSDECLLLFGIGDGGGGPGEEHLERLNREKNLQGLAPVTQGFASEFFDRISKNIENYKTWNGELYLEHHRGTYTSEGRNKRYNKIMENMLRDLEIISCIAGNGYDQERIEEIWKEILLYQFHDILPGSSIKRVYDESLKRYELLLKETKDMSGIDPEEPIPKAVVFNTLSWIRKEWIKIGDEWRYFEIAPMSSVPLSNALKKNLNVSINRGNDTIENSFLKVKFNSSGNIISLWDKNNKREAINTVESANKLHVYKDEGDAWDFPHDYREHGELELHLLSSEYVIDGPEVKKINKFKMGNSTIEQEIVLRDGSGRVDFRTKIDWHEKNTMIRSAFPLSVSSPNLTCGIQFGYVERSSTENTLWDMAKIEVCGQNYVDKSKNGYGVAVLSDYKYGYSSKENLIEICLLRSTTYPDIDGDIGIHEFTYSLYPHSGNHIAGNVIETAFELSRPLRLINPMNEKLYSDSSFAITDKKNVHFETLKVSEDGTGLILRLNEAYGIGTESVINFKNHYSKITEVNLVERQVGDKTFSGNEIKLEFRPFDIKTLKLIV